MISRWNFFLLKLPLLSFVFNHNSHFEVSNTIKELTAQRGAWVIVRSFVFRAGEIAVDSARRNDFPGEGLWRELGLAFNRNVTPALRQVCVECRQRGVRTHTRLPAELRVLHRSALLAPDPVCSAPIRERDHLQASVLEQTSFLSSSPESLFFFFFFFYYYYFFL